MKKGKKGGKKEKAQTPIMEPVIPPTAETDPWLVPEGPPAPSPEVSPELPPALTADLFGVGTPDDALPIGNDPQPTVLPPHRQQLMWVGVAVCMAIVVGGWVWSLRYSLRLPPQPASDSALSDALEQFRSQTASFGQDLSEIKAGLAVVDAEGKEPPAPSQDEVIKTLKEKLSEAAAENQLHP